MLPQNQQLYQMKNEGSSQLAKRAFTYGYLCSCPRSGSTLVASLLAYHPEVSTVGEFGEPFAKKARCTCGSMLESCELWVKWEERARKEGLDFEIGNVGIALINHVQKSYWEDFYYHLFPSRLFNRARDVLFTAASHYPQKAKEVIARSVRLAQILCEMEGTACFFDSSKIASQVRFLSKYSNVSLRVIGLVRDGRATMCSLMEKLGKTKEEAVRDWLWWNRTIERTIAHYANPATVFRLRLEDLCRNPSGVMDALCQFLGLNPIGSFDYRNKSKYHVLGNPTRHQFNGELRLDESWKTKLTRESLDYFRRHAGKMNRHYGYED